MSGSTFYVCGAAAPYDESVDIRVMDPTEAWRTNGTHNFAGVGNKLASGDINGDCFDDVVMGLQGNINESVYVIFGKTASFEDDLSVASLDGSNGFSLTGAHSGSILAIAHLNGDALTMLLFRA